MGLQPQLITEDLYRRAKEALSGINKDNRIGIRLMAIISAKEHGVGAVAKVFNITGNTLRSWVRGFDSGGALGLEYREGRGRKSNLSEVHCRAIGGLIEEDCNITIKNIVLRLEKDFKMRTSKSAVHRALQRLKVSYITPRPVHHKQDKEAQDEFKKKS